LKSFAKPTTQRIRILGWIFLIAFHSMYTKWKTIKINANFNNTCMS
jgi:hypothetical protein